MDWVAGLTVEGALVAAVMGAADWVGEAAKWAMEGGLMEESTGEAETEEAETLAAVERQAALGNQGMG